jgi:UDP-N-acetylglucosamine 2-epimerase (non-hydrolysing)
MHSWHLLILVLCRKKCVCNIPTVTIRDSTERPETVWCGSNIVSGLNTDQIIQSYEQMKNTQRKWEIPQGYDKENVSDTVLNILLSNRDF